MALEMTVADGTRVPVARARKDIREATKRMTLPEIRFLVDLYYSTQDFRISSGNQIRALGKIEAADETAIPRTEGADEPDNLLTWSNATFETVESEIRKGLDLWTRTEPSGICVWSRSLVGIGPVLAAGLLAHIDITRAASPSHIWRFAGLDPTSVWERGQKRPWNASLKVICWKIGESFVKVSGNKDDVYGKLYIARKAQEVERNEQKLFAEQAQAILEKKKIGKTTDAYKAYAQGLLPPAHVHARAKRYAVKQFLADWHHVAWELTYGTLPPRPYPIEHLGHVDIRPVPNHTCLGDGNGMPR